MENSALGGITVGKDERPPIAERLLMFAFRKNNDLGRNPTCVDWYDDLRETIFRYSSNYIHSTQLALGNIVYWDELNENDMTKQHMSDGSALPDIFTGFASITTGLQIKFAKALKKLVTENLIYGFLPSFRAISNLGGKRIPLFEIYDVKSSSIKPSDIIAYSLTESGFHRGKELAGKYKNINDLPWEIHRVIEKSKEVAENISLIKMSDLYSQ